MSRGIVAFAVGALLVHGRLIAADVVEEKTAAKYCGISYLGSRAESPTISPIKARLDDSTYLTKLNGRMVGLAKPALSSINMLDSNSSDTATALTFMFTAARHDEQTYFDPLKKQEQYFNIFTVQVQSVFFNADSFEVQGIYPWTFRYTSKSEKQLTKAEVGEQFAALLDAEPQAVEEGEGQPADVMLYHWAQGLGGVRPAGKEKTLSVAPIQFSDSALQTLTTAAAGEKDPQLKLERVKEDLRAHFESELSRTLKLPVVPGGGAGNYVVTLGDCAKSSNGEKVIVLPTPAFRFSATVEELATGSRETESKRQVAGAGGQVSEQVIKQTEIAYGARFNVGVYQVEDAVSENGELAQKANRILDNQFRSYSAIKFSGERMLNELEQYNKLGLAFFGSLTSAFVNRDEKWIKDNLSAERKKDKPSSITKEWEDVFGKKIGVQKPKKRA